MDGRVQCIGMGGSDGVENYKCVSNEVVQCQTTELGEEEARQSVRCGSNVGGRFTSILRSSLRLSSSTGKASNTIATAPVSPHVTSHGSRSRQGLGSTLSVCSYSFPFCRICHESNEPGTDMEFDSCGRLIAPCLCDGSLKYVHEKCIQQWIEISQSRKCELCHFEYETRRYTKPIKEWKFFSLERQDLRKLFCFVTIYALIQACVAWALYALISNLTSSGTSGSERNWQFWLKVFVVLVGMFSVGVFAYVQARYCCDICQRWRRLNRVCVVREPSKERLAKMRMEQRLPTSRFCVVNEVETFTAMP